MTTAPLSTDQTLQGSVQEELTFDPRVNAAHIGVIAQGGVVTLTGKVPTWLERWEAERAALRVAGVMGLVNSLEVDLPATHQRDDADLAEAAVNALASNVLVPQGRVRVNVHAGVVSLEGGVDWQYQRQAAEAAVRPLIGVRGTINMLTVQHTAAPANARDVKKEVTRAFHRHATLDAARLHVEVRGNTVTLSGTVRSWAEHQDAEQAAWATPGVGAVLNKLTLRIPGATKGRSRRETA